MAAVPASPQFTDATPDGKLRITLHSGQTRAWDSTKRFVLILAGLQSG
jgi:hypothetical protein